MRRFQKVYDGDLSSHQRDGHLIQSQLLKCNNDYNGNSYSRSSTPSSLNSLSKDCRSYKRIRAFELDTSPTKRTRKISCSDTMQIEFSNCDDSVSIYNNIEDDEQIQNSNECLTEPDPVASQCFEDSDLPPLLIPQSSSDLLVERKFLMSLLGIYEVLKRFHRHLRLSHFRFEDFCLAVKSSNQSPLLAEICICLTKALIRADDCINVVYGPHEVKDSINIFLNSLDYMSWYDIMKYYIASKCCAEYESMLQLLSKSSFFSNSIEEKVSLMHCLTDLFLKTDLARSEISREGSFQHEDQCRLCHKLGDLLCCEMCPAVYHLECVGLTEVPQGDWICAACKQSEMAGVTECISLAEREGTITRITPLGLDRHLRRYWFLSRRIFVESETDIVYYSTKEQFEKLLEILDQECYEKCLHKALIELQPEILRQMDVTIQLTRNFQKDRHSVFDAILNDFSMCHKGPSPGIKQSEVSGKVAIMSTDTSSEVPECLPDIKSVNRPKLGMSLSKHSNDTSFPLKASKSSSENTYTVGKEGALKTRSYVPLSSTQMDDDCPGSCCFKLGMEGSCFGYENHYSTNSLSVSRHLYIEEKEKRRHLSYKFSIPLSGEFRWVGPTSGNQQCLVNTFKETLLQLESCFLPCLMVHNWSSRKWLQQMHESSDIQKLSHLMVDLQLGIRPILFNHIWHDALGHLSLKKMSATDKDDIKKSQRWRLDDEEEEELVSSGEWVKYTLGVKHQLWKVKGEEFRIFGNGGWLWVGINRKSQHMPASELGLRRIARESQAITKTSFGSESKEFNGDHSNFPYKSKKTGKCCSDLDKLTLKDDFSICDNILNGNFYLLTHKPPSKLDGLLEERLKQLKNVIELKEYFEPFVVEFLKSEVKKSGVGCLNIKNGGTLNEATIRNSCTISSKHQVSNDISQLASSNDRFKGVCNQESGQNITDLTSMTLAELREMLKGGTLQISQALVSLVQEKLKELLRTDVKTSLGKLNKGKNSLICADETERSPNLNILSRGHASLFVLESSLVRSLARREGKFEVPGFSYNCKTNNANWPYPAPRPLFKTAWQHRTQNSSSLAALCSQLRIMWACLKWDDLMTKPPSLPIHTVATEISIKSTEVLAKRNVVKDLQKFEYLVRELHLPLADDSKIHEVYTPQRSGLRERKKASLTLLDPIITEKWVPEDSVELWQIKYLEERLDKQKTKSKENMKDDPPTKLESGVVEGVQTSEQNMNQEHHPPQSKLGAQKITVVPKADGQVEIHGLQENQQIIQLPNGDIHIATSLDANESRNLAFVLGPKIPLPQSGSLELFETKVSEKASSVCNDAPGIIPHSPLSVTPQLLLQVVGQVLMHTHNSEVREKLVSVQKLIQQKLHPTSSIDSNSEANSRLTPVVGKVTKNATPTISQEEKEDQLRLAICGQVMRQMLDTIEKNERQESKNLKKQEAAKGKIRQIVSSRLEIELQRRKDELRRDILYKKTIMEKILRQKIQANIKIEREQLVVSEIESESNMEEKSTRSQMSSTSMQSDSETSCFLQKKKRQKSETEILPTEELFCLCRTPYDSSKFYIGCDHCENWFHGSCVGITKPEAEKLNTYVCPNCRQPNSRSVSSNMSFCESHWQEVEKVVINLKTHKSAWPFLRPVDPNDAPDYYSIITEPMDLSTVEKKVLKREYKTLPDFINDVMKIFENCRYYNARNTKFYKCADILEIYFSDKLRTLRTRLKIH